MSKRRADDMDVDDEPMGKRARKPTEKGAEFAATLQRKKAAILARIESKKTTAKTKPEIDELAALFSKVNMADSDEDVDALTAQLSRMGGRRRRTLKKKRHGARRTRKH